MQRWSECVPSPGRNSNHLQIWGMACLSRPDVILLTVICMVGSGEGEVNRTADFIAGCAGRKQRPVQALFQYEQDSAASSAIASIYEVL